VGGAGKAAGEIQGGRGEGVGSAGAGGGPWPGDRAHSRGWECRVGVGWPQGAGRGTNYQAEMAAGIHRNRPLPC